MSAIRSPEENSAVATLAPRDLLRELLAGTHLMAVVPMTLLLVERDPLASGGCFKGDLMRGLMEISGHFWGRHPRLYERYVRALRASASARRVLPREERMEFWSVLDRDCVGSSDDASRANPDRS